MCEICKSSFSRQRDLKRHIIRIHSGQKVYHNCFICSKLFEDYTELKEHHNVYHTDLGHDNYFELWKESLQETFAIFRHTFSSDIETLDQIQTWEVGAEIKKLLTFELLTKLHVKYSLNCNVEMLLLDGEGAIVSEANICLRSDTFHLSETDISEAEQQILLGFDKHVERVESFVSNGSNWVLSRVLSLDVEIAKVRPIVVGGNTEAPNLRSIMPITSQLLNINTGAKCLLFATVAFFFGETEKNSVNEEDYNKYLHLFNTNGINFPSTLNEVERFSKINKKLSFNFNIFYKSKDGVFPIKVNFGNQEAKLKINLLLLWVKKDETPKNKSEYHFVLIKNLNKFLRTTYRGETTNRLSYKKSFFCENCLNNFSNLEKLEKHKSFCGGKGCGVEYAPKKGEKISFSNVENTCMEHLVAYADFECVLIPSKIQRTCKECLSLYCKCDTSSTVVENLHEPFSYHFVIVSKGEKIVMEKSYTGKDAGQHFVTMLLSIEADLQNTFDRKKVMNPLSREQKEKRPWQKDCYLCNLPLVRNGNVDIEIKQAFVVHDHDHLTGEYIGLAHASCNLRRQRQSKLKVYFHNGGRYDFHLIVPHLHLPGIRKLSVLAKNTESFRAINFNIFSIRDSMFHLSAGLSGLCKNLKDDKHKFHLIEKSDLTKTNGVFDKKKFDLLLGKSFFPYEFCTSIKLMQQTKTLPERIHFYSKLTEETITEAEHQFAEQVWETFECKNLLEYSNVYVQIDVLILAEIFENYRVFSHKFSGLDPVHYLGTPGFSFDSMLKITKVEIELLSDIDQIYFLESGIRGGVSMINTRYLKGQSQPEDPPSNSDFSIFFVDANNLYGGAQKEFLPLKDFKWLDEDEMEELANSVEEVSATADEGYILEVDLHYPPELHKLHGKQSCLPFCTVL
jgi:hypothetical protein